MSDTIHVLHVDDEPSMGDMVATFLERGDDRITVQTATNAENGREILADNDVDCIVSDYDMPGMSGIEFLETIREDGLDLPFILYTGKGSEEVASDAISAGVTDYLQKESGTDQYAVLANRVVNVVEQYRAEREVEQTRTQLEAISEHSTDAIIIIDANSYIQFANPAVEDHFGYSPSELQGQRLTTIMPQRYREQHLAAIDQYLETGTRSLDWKNVEFSGLHKDGTEVPLSVSYGEFQQEGEQRFIGIMRDMSERTQIEEELREREERFRQLAENIEEVVWMSDPEKEELLYVNPSYENIWGQSTESLYDDPTAFLEAVHPEDQSRVEAALTSQTSGEYDEEYRIIRPDGELRWVRDRAVPVINDMGEVYRMVGIASDITDRKEHEQELERTNALLSTLIESLPMGVLVEDGSRNVLAVNERFVELFGRSDTPEELIGDDCEQLVDEVSDMFVDPERFVQQTNKLIANQTASHDAELVLQDGRTLARNHEPIELLDGEGHLWVYWDITNRTEREEQLHEAISRLETLFDNSPDMIDILDSEGTLLEVNRRLCDELGYDEDEVLGRPIWEIDQLVDTEDVNTLLSDFALDERRKFEGRYERRDGSTLPVEVHLLRLDIEGEDRFLAISRDITERKEYERQLENEQQFVHSIFNAVPDPLYTFDVSGHLLRWNTYVEEITGYTSDELDGMAISEFVPEDESEVVAEKFQEVLDKREPTTVESVLKTKSGECIPYEFTAGPLENADGELRGSTGVGRDLTARKEREERLRALNQTAQDLMAATTTEQVAEIGVQAAKDILKLEANGIFLYKEEQAGLVPIAVTDGGYELVGDPPVLTEGNSIAWRVYKQGKPATINEIGDDPDVYNPETVVESELIIPIEGYGVLIAGSEDQMTFEDEDVVLGEILVGSIATALEQVDRTEQLQAREQELQQQNERLEEFTGVVSHDLRNPLAIADGRLELAQEECDSDHLEHVERALNRMGALIEDLLTLARENEAVAEPNWIDLTTTAQDCWANVETGDATLVTDAERMIYADESRLKQVLENLVRNAVEHGSDDVTVTIGELDDGFYVEDDGPGISEDERSDVFEAGYSTQEVGTGFGLSIVKQVVESHGWEIIVAEGSEGGARFEITGVKFTDE